LIHSDRVFSRSSSILQPFEETDDSTHPVTLYASASSATRCFWRWIWMRRFLISILNCASLPLIRRKSWGRSLNSLIRHLSPSGVNRYTLIMFFLAALVPCSRWKKLTIPPIL
jgi:hypothetical protein